MRQTLLDILGPCAISLLPALTSCASLKRPLEHLALGVSVLKAPVIYKRDRIDNAFSDTERQCLEDIADAVPPDVAREPMYRASLANLPSDACQRTHGEDYTSLWADRNNVALSETIRLPPEMPLIDPLNDFAEKTTLVVVTRRFTTTLVRCGRSSRPHGTRQTLRLARRAVERRRPGWSAVDHVSVGTTLSVTWR
jgi:hypothetical protein